MLRSYFNVFVLVTALMIFFSFLQAESVFFAFQESDHEEAYQKILNEILSVSGTPDSLDLVLNYLEESIPDLKKHYKSKVFSYKIEYLKEYFRGRYYSIYFHSEEAETPLKKAIEIALLNRNKKLQLNAEFELANFYSYQGYYNTARKKYEESLNLVRSLGDESREFQLLHNLAIINKYLGNYHESISWFEEAEIFKIEQGRQDELGMLYNNLGSAYNEMGEQEKALSNYQKSEQLLNIHGTDGQRAIIYNNLGNYDMQFEEFDKALNYFERSLKLKDPETASYMTTLINKGILYNNRGDQQAALELINGAEVICIKKGFELQLIEIYYFMADYSEDEGNYEKALEFLNKSQKSSAKLKEKDAVIYEADLRNVYQIEEHHRHKEMEETEAIIHRTRTQVNQIILICILFIIAVLINGMIYTTRRKAFRKKQIAKLLEKNNILEEHQRKATDVLNILQKMRNHLENQIDRAVTKIRNRDSMIMIQSRNSVVGEMIGNIAHQWRQPLNAIGLIIQDFSEAYIFGELNDEYIEKKLVIINNLLDYMHQTIDDFKNFFDPEKKEHAFSAGYILQRAIEFVSSTYAARNIDYTINKEDDFEIFGTENELFQALINILNNAKDAFQDKNIARPRVQLKLWKEQDMGIISIQDNAGGIKSDVIDKVFDPYFTTKSEKKGTGIGLYIVCYIIEKNFKGSVAVENRDNGARFLIKLPIGFE